MKKLFIFAIMGLLLVMQTQATTLLYTSFDDLVKEADGIIMGTVKKIEPIMDNTGMINTYVTLGDLTIIDGLYEGKEFTIVMEGGEVNSEAQVVSGIPDFRIKEKLILFIKGNGYYIVPLVGWGQGMFIVKKDSEASGSDKEVMYDCSGNRVFSIKSGHVIKEQRAETDAEIIDIQEDGIEKSEIYYTNPGENHDGSIDSSDNLSPASCDNAMGREQFIQEIQHSVKAKTTIPQRLTSVKIGEKIKAKENKNEQ